MLKTRLILFLSVLLLINASVSAHHLKNGPYLKITVGLNRNINAQAADPDINFRLTQKPKGSPIYGAGIGYYLTPSTRIDLTYEHVRAFFNKKSGCFNCVDGFDFIIGTQEIRRSALSHSVMANGYIDVLTRPTFKVFLGGGLGISRIKEKVSSKFESTVITEGISFTLPTIYSSAIHKTKNSFAYAGTAGLDININPRLNFELAYSFKHYGTAKNTYVNNKYRGHNFSTALRLDL